MIELHETSWLVLSIDVIRFCNGSMPQRRLRRNSSVVQRLFTPLWHQGQRACCSDATPVVQSSKLVNANNSYLYVPAHVCI
jgi:hypothetical protein